MAWHYVTDGAGSAFTSTGDAYGVRVRLQASHVRCTRRVTRTYLVEFDTRNEFFSISKEHLLFLCRFNIHI